MKRLGYSELFYSLQGEGLYTGTPSIFLRLFGCNFRCKSFGRSLGTEFGKYNPEVKDVIDNIDEYKSFNELPLVKTGCDSYGSVYPEFKRFAKFESPYEVAEKITSLLPDNRFSNNKHLVMTGGEPLLPGWQKSFVDLFDTLIDSDLSHVTFETNGTQILHDDVADKLWGLNIFCTFSVSSKLAPSGETFEDAIKPDAIRSYLTIADSLFFKWVIATEKDVDEVNRAIDAYSQHIDMSNIPIYVMPVGGTTESYFLNNKRVAEIALKNGWKYSPRLQVDLWKNRWGS